MQQLVDIILGVRVEGEPIGEPNFKTTTPSQQPTFFEWCNSFNVSRAYGMNKSWRDQVRYSLETK